MTRERRSGGRKGKSNRSSQEIAQLPWQQVKNSHAPMELLNSDHLDQLHKTSLRILSEAGIRVMSDKVLDIFEAAGAIIDRDEMLIRIDESIVDAALATVPSKFTLTSRNPEKQIILGGNNMNFSLVAGPPFVRDMINGRRQGNHTDYCNFIKLAHHFNAITMLGNQVMAPLELPANSRHLDTYLANITYSDLSFHCTAIGRGRAMDGINMMAISRGITVEEMKSSPGLMTMSIAE